MKSVQVLTITEQTAAHLRRGLSEGRWSGKLPGVVRLAADCKVSTGVVRKALRLLEDEGLLSGRGLGRSRSIAADAVKTRSRPLRVAILRHDARMEDNPQTSMVLADISHSLEEAGHDAVYFRKSQVGLKHRLSHLTRLMEETPADAWVVEAGSRPLLEWCSKQTTPCLALYGRADGLPITYYGPEAGQSCGEATRHLIALGHRRIVLIISEARRKPTPGITATSFLREMDSHGVVTGDYHLPDWQETPEGLYQLLEKLFGTTPPTALIVDEVTHFFAAMAYCVRRGIRVPEQVSLISLDSAILMGWCHPAIAQIRWDHASIVRSVVRWANSLQKGKPDHKSIIFPAKFVPGGSTCPPRRG